MERNECTFFLQVTKTQCEDIISGTYNLCINFLLLIIFHNKIWQRQELCNFFLQWPWTCWMTLGQDQGTPLWEVKLPIVFYKKDIDWTSIMHFLFQWSWTCPNGSRSWHILRSYLIFVCSRNIQCFSIINKMGQTQLHRQTDVWRFLYSLKFCLGGGGWNMKTYNTDDEINAVI